MTSVSPTEWPVFRFCVLTEFDLDRSSHHLVGKNRNTRLDVNSRPPSGFSGTEKLHVFGKVHQFVRGCSRKRRHTVKTVPEAKTGEGSQDSYNVFSLGPE